MFTMSRTQHQLTVGTLLWGLCLSSAPELWALEKYGRPLPEMEEAHEQSEEHWIHGYLLSGAFVSNPSFAARPDNTGRALFRYVAHADLDLYRNRVVLFVDGNFFTDRSAANALRPSEFDLVIGLAVRYQDTEFALIHERDMPLDRGGLVQRYFALQLRHEFEWAKSSSPAGTQLSLHR